MKYFIFLSVILLAGCDTGKNNKATKKDEKETIKMVSIKKPEINCFYIKNKGKSIYHKTGTFMGKTMLVPAVEYLSLGERDYRRVFGYNGQLEAKKEEMKPIKCPDQRIDKRKFRKKIDSAIAREKKEERDREKKMVRSLTGNWGIGNYVDNFGDKTGSSYIYYKNGILGKFSNSATTNSPLRVDILINDYKNIDIRLYEYGKDHNKVEGTKTMYFFVKDGEGQKHSFKGELEGSKEASSKIHKILKKGGSIQFVIKGKGCYESCRYEFSLDSVDHYYNVYRNKFNIE